MSRGSIIRDDLISDIDTLIAASKFIRNDIDTEATNEPVDELKALETPKLWFVILGGDETVKTRDRHWEGEKGIQLILKCRVDLANTDDCDQLETLLDQLKIVCRQHAGKSSIAFNGTTYRFSYHSNRLEPMRDLAGTPYAYGILREAGVFEGIVTNYYHIESE